MGKVILYIATSLDGYIAGKNGDISWLEKYQTKDDDYGYGDFYKSISAAIMGANTYRQELTFKEWPHPDKRTYVISNSKLEKPRNADIEFYNGSLSKLINNIKDRDKKDIWLVGGSQLIASFINEELLEEARIFIIPTILKEGIPLFKSIEKEIQLSFVKSKEYLNCVVELNYSVKK